MNGLQIDGILISGAVLGFLIQPEERGTSVLLCFLFVGVKITWW